MKAYAEVQVLVEVEGIVTLGDAAESVAKACEAAGLTTVVRPIGFSGFVFTTGGPAAP